MNRFKQMWLILVGRARAFEVSQEAFLKIHSEADRYRMDAGDLVETAVELHEEMAGGALDQMVNELGVIGEINDIEKGMEL